MTKAKASLSLARHAIAIYREEALTRPDLGSPYFIGLLLTMMGLPADEQAAITSELWTADNRRRRDGA